MDFINKLFNSNYEYLSSEYDYNDFVTGCFTCKNFDELLSGFYHPIIYINRKSLSKLASALQKHETNPFSFNRRTQEYNYYGMYVPIKIIDGTYGKDRIIIVEEKCDKFFNVYEVDQWV